MTDYITPDRGVGAQPVRLKDHPVTLENPTEMPYSVNRMEHKSHVPPRPLPPPPPPPPVT